MTAAERTAVQTAASDWQIVALGPTARALLEAYRSSVAFLDAAIAAEDEQAIALARADFDRAVRLLAAAVDAAEVVTRELGG